VGGGGGEGRPAAAALGSLLRSARRARLVTAPTRPARTAIPPPPPPPPPPQARRPAARSVRTGPPARVGAPHRAAGEPPPSALPAPPGAGAGAASRVWWIAPPARAGAGSGAGWWAGAGAGAAGRWAASARHAQRAQRAAGSAAAGLGVDSGDRRTDCQTFCCCARPRARCGPAGRRLGRTDGLPDQLLLRSAGCGQTVPTTRRNGLPVLRGLPGGPPRFPVARRGPDLRELNVARPHTTRSTSHPTPNLKHNPSTPYPSRWPTASFNPSPLLGVPPPSLSGRDNTSESDRAYPFRPCLAARWPVAGEKGKGGKGAGRSTVTRVSEGAAASRGLHRGARGLQHGLGSLGRAWSRRLGC
jgi:hypothetical protein